MVVIATPDPALAGLQRGDVLVNVAHHAAICLGNGKIVNAGAEESVIGEDGKVEPGKIQALIFDQFRNGYYVVGEKVGQGWNAGKELVKKAQGKSSGHYVPDL